jgi:F-type H+-transporting ATPase subunit c
MGLAIAGIVIGIGMIIIGAALGIGKIGAAAAEGIARQPEASGKIQGAAIILAALIEGATFFALVLALMTGNKVTRENWSDRAELNVPAAESRELASRK